ncbi:MAG: hypothetical protein WED00_15690 [Aquisalimonadaceae bacterium]
MPVAMNAQPCPHRARPIIRALATLALLATFASHAEVEVGASYFGTVRMGANADSEPSPITIMAGGRQRADLIHGDCTGFIQKATADVNLDYRGDATELFIHARSATDTTLVVRAPDGTIHCDDDTMNFDPMVSFPDARNGVYRIWVGTFVNQPTRAKIHISATDPRTPLQKMLLETLNR